MTIEEAKSIRIADYLYSLGYSPVKQQGINLWYKSPFREESEASFKVNTEREQWYDFGLGKGGNIIALAAHLYATDHIPYILKRIAEQTPHVRPVSFSFGKQSSSEPSFQQLEIVPLSSPALLAYLQSRRIRSMKTKNKIPMRQCTGCREMKSKKEMIRVLKTPEDEIVLDTTGRKNGRGAYVCLSIECLDKAIRNHGIERSLKTSVPEEVYEDLKKELSKIEKQQ